MHCDKVRTEGKSSSPENLPVASSASCFMLLLATSKQTSQWLLIGLWYDRWIIKTAAADLIWRFTRSNHTISCVDNRWTSPKLHFFYNFYPQFISLLQKSIIILYCLLRWFLIYFCSELMQHHFLKCNINRDHNIDAFK